MESLTNYPLSLTHSFMSETFTKNGKYDKWCQGSGCVYDYNFEKKSSHFQPMQIKHSIDELRKKCHKIYFWDTKQWMSVKPRFLNVHLLSCEEFKEKFKESQMWKRTLIWKKESWHRKKFEKEKERIKKQKKDNKFHELNEESKMFKKMNKKYLEWKCVGHTWMYSSSIFTMWLNLIEEASSRGV